MHGCDCYAYGLLASGFCDLVVEADLKPYDYMVWRGRQYKPDILSLSLSLSHTLTHTQRGIIP